MEQFDKMLKEMAEQEEYMVPKGFDRRLQGVLDNLPSRAKKRGLGAVKGVLIAVAACAALLCTAFAASPELRGMLAEALGSFAPYAQDQDSGVYTWNGLEFEVLAALADENTVRVYTRITDLEEQGRLNLNDERWMGKNLMGMPWLDIYVPNTSVDVTGGCSSTNFEHYDEVTRTTIAVTTIWGQITDNLTGAELRIDTGENRMNGKSAVTIPLNVEVMPSRTVFHKISAAGITVEEIKISPLGVTVLVGKAGDLTLTGLDTTFRVRLKDGIEIGTERDNASGHGVYRDQNLVEHQALIWNFAEPVELDQVAGLWIGADYFPVE